MARGGLERPNPAKTKTHSGMGVKETHNFMLWEKVLLWLQRRGRSHHAAAATATLFSQNLLKPVKYWHFFSRNRVLIIKQMKINDFAHISTSAIWMGMKAICRIWFSHSRSSKPSKIMSFWSFGEKIENIEKSKKSSMTQNDQECLKTPPEPF